jgi:hypothetical protein
MVERNPDKGKVRGGECNRTACDSRRAKYYNTVTDAYYCGGCAKKINYWSKRDSGIDICILPENAEYNPNKS